LGVERSFNSVGFYLAYLAACRRIAAEAGVDLRMSIGFQIWV
jgi:hypothetical protein